MFSSHIISGLLSVSECLINLYFHLLPNHLLDIVANTHQNWKSQDFPLFNQEHAPPYLFLLMIYSFYQSPIHEALAWLLPRLYQPLPTSTTIQSFTRFCSFCLKNVLHPTFSLFLFFVFTGPNLIQAHSIYYLEYLLQKYF